MKSNFYYLVFILSLTDLVCSNNEPYIQPSNPVQGQEGKSLKVSCHAKNLQHPPKKIFWMLKPESGHFRRIPNFRQQQVDATTSTFFIQHLNRSDAGVYQCVLVFHDNTEKVSNLILHVVGKNFSSLCGHTRFRCQSTENCIFLRYRCDGVPHCSDKSDEINCGDLICQGKFQCENGRCIDLVFQCDGSDNCGDYSDEIRCNKHIMDMNEGENGVTLVSTVTPSVSDSDHFNWLKTTVYIVIGCTVALVIFISFIVIVVFRVKMKRLRARRVARALERHRRHQSGSGTRQGEHETFLPNSRYGNIIVNVNNGVQYVPNSEFTGLMESPPSYAEVVGIDVDVRDSPPPAYSTIDRNPKTTTETATNTSRVDLSAHSVTQAPPQTSARAHPSNIFASVEGANNPVHNTTATTSATNCTSTCTNSVLTTQSPSSTLSNRNITDNMRSLSRVRGPDTSNPQPSSSSPAHNNIFMSVEGAASPLDRPTTSRHISLEVDTRVQVDPTSSSQPLSAPILNHLTDRSNIEPQNLASLSPSSPDNQARHEPVQSSDITHTDELSEDVIPSGGGHLMIQDGKLYLRSDSSSSAGASSNCPPIKGHLEVKDGQIVIKQNRTGPGPVEDISRSYDSDDSSICGHAIGVQDGKIVLR